MPAIPDRHADSVENWFSSQAIAKKHDRKYCKNFNNLLISYDNLYKVKVYNTLTGALGSGFPAIRFVKSPRLMYDTLGVLCSHSTFKGDTREWVGFWDSLAVSLNLYS